MLKNSTDAAKLFKDSVNMYRLLFDKTNTARFLVVNIMVTSLAYQLG